MSFKNIKQGWYKVINPEKIIKPLDEHMGSYKDGCFQYKSSLELKAFQYADINSNVKRWSIEPWPIYYIKPTDGKRHRYYIDMFIEFNTGDKFLVEIKPESQTVPPIKSKIKSEKSNKRYNKELSTYYINQAKWKAAKEFANTNGMKFIILTDKILN